MQLYARTETEQYYPKEIVSAAGRFIVIKLGWFSYAFLLDEDETYRPYNITRAMQQVDALRALDE